MNRIIVYAIPIFAIFIGIEFAYGWIKGRNTYRLNDAISSLSQGVLSQAVAVCTQLFQIGLYTLIYPHIALVQGASLWESWPGWLLAIVLYDLCDYWLHRAGHESAILWAAHVVHHQSQCFNLSTALRQESAYALLGWVFYLPLALIGVPPELYGIAGLVVLVYQFWIHTEHVGKLGWFDRIFSSPSNHRVHHAVNDRYIDKNYGAVLVLWDRIFGTFEEENEPCVYGTRTPLNSWDPVWAVAEVYWSLFLKVRRTRSWRDKIRVLFKAPGWQPPDLATEAFEQPFEPHAVPLFDPPMKPARRWAACIVFLAVLIACCRLLWQADDLSYRLTWVAAVATAAGLWVVGALMSGRLGWVTGSLLGGLATYLVMAASSAPP